MTGSDEPDNCYRLAACSRAVPIAIAKYLAPGCQAENTLALEGSAG